MCLSRSGVRSISGFRRALMTNGATALTSCTSSSSTDDTSCEQQPPRVAAAQVDLLQILIEPPCAETGRLSPGSSSGSSATCESWRTSAGRVVTRNRVQIRAPCPPCLQPRAAPRSLPSIMCA